MVVVEKGAFHWSPKGKAMHYRPLTRDKFAHCYEMGRKNGLFQPKPNSKSRSRAVPPVFCVIPHCSQATNERRNERFFKLIVLQRSPHDIWTIVLPYLVSGMILLVMRSLLGRWLCVVCFLSFSAVGGDFRLLVVLLLRTSRSRGATECFLGRFGQ
jgi:hypothetical protein